MVDLQHKLVAETPGVSHLRAVVGMPMGCRGSWIRKCLLNKLTTTADGGISRTVNGHPLPYDSFSTGKGMGAAILMRLLIAQMATTADFCWFDEPLEHLDPDVRRRVANLLARVTATGGPLRQVVVTTYEEPLARQLEARDPFNVKLIDVRQTG